MFLAFCFLNENFYNFDNCSRNYKSKYNQIINLIIFERINCFWQLDYNHYYVRKKSIFCVDLSVNNFRNRNLFS